MFCDSDHSVSVLTAFSLITFLLLREVQARNKFYRTLSLFLFIFEKHSSHKIQASGLPHVSECNFCMRCISSEKYVAPVESSTAEMFSKIFPSAEDIKAKQLKPNCTDCQGCSVQLEPLKAVSAFGQDFSIETGASPEWIFKADLPRGEGRVVIKVWCMPFDKVSGAFQWHCKTMDHAASSNQVIRLTHI